MPSQSPTHSCGDTADPSLAPKIAIPRLEGRHVPRKEKPRQTQPSKSRTQRACDNCRKRKVRCTGEVPQCRNCEEQNVPCAYSMARRDRFKEATEHNGRLIALLRDLSLHVDQTGQKMIEEHLDSVGSVNARSIFTNTPKHGDESPVAVLNTTPATLGKHLREPSSSEDEGASDESSESVHALDEDLLRSQESRATGFVGTNSSVQWLRSLRTQMASTGRQKSGVPSQDSGRTSHTRKLRASDFTFYLDRDDLELDIMVDPYEMLPPKTAEKLFDCYMQTIHESFPILPDIFEAQFRRYNEAVTQGRRYQVPGEWQALLNLALAIGAQYSHLTQAEWRGEEDDHLILMTRATRILRLDKIATSLPAPNLTFIQATGLLSLYYLTIGQVSRAWMMIGISLRFALAAGLHLRNDNPSIMASKKEMLAKTWWSLHSIESFLCTIIGRPCIISTDACTVPLPQIIPKAQATDHGSIRSQKSTRRSRSNSDTVPHSSFLGAHVAIALIMQKALAKLYAPQLSDDSWDRIQTDITALTSELGEWAITAHLAGLGPASSLEESGVERTKLILSFHYHSAKLLICRPCLCRIERRNKGQSEASADFYQRTAGSCVQAAQAITRLLPDRLNLKFIYEQTPWWCVVHNIMQAIAVLLLKISLGRTHKTHDGEELSGSVKKLVRWLRCMSISNDVAERAYSVVFDIINSSAARVGINIADITSDKYETSTNTTNSYQSFSSPGSTASFPLQQIPQPYPQQQYSANTSPNTFPPPPSWPASSQDPYSATTTTTTQTPTPSNPYASPITTEFNLDLQYSTPQTEQTPFLLFDTGTQMPSVVGNPFLTNFDQADVLANVFSLGNDGTSSDGYTQGSNQGYR